MALGDYTIFSWKNKETLAREQEEYGVWAFPHGEEQREKLETLMQELCPKEPVAFLLMGFLTCKELYERFVKKLGSSEKAVDYLLNKEKKYKSIIRKKEMPRYVALVLADTEYEKRGGYPTANDIQALIDRNDEIYINRKGF